MRPRPRDRPSLEIASPGDTTGLGHGWRDGHRHRWEMLFGDGRWRPVAVRAWWSDDRGRLVVQVEWWDEAGMTTRGGTYLVDRQKMREG
jgi:hypothetical protein